MVTSSLLGDGFSRVLFSVIRIFFAGDEDEENYRNMQLRQLYMDETSNTSWWQAMEDCTDTLYEKYFSRLPYADCTNFLVIYMFNDKIFPSTISSIAAGG